jgi:hypothetical protein
MKNVKQCVLTTARGPFCNALGISQIEVALR